MKITTRDAPPRAVWTLQEAGIHPLLARLFAARGVRLPAELDDALAQLHAPQSMAGIDAAVNLLCDAMARDASLCVVADYDCDGATACAVAVRGLRMLGARNVQYVVPDRVVDGYGLTAPISERVAAAGADVLITVDNGIASCEGVVRARSLGLAVLVTDHHLPGPVLPDAQAIVNPNQPGCTFPSKNLAGVGVMFYVLLALRARLRELGRFTLAQQPRLDRLLPLVALGTVADVVRLDSNNRRLVAQGLRRIRQGQAPAGILSLFSAARRDHTRATAFDLGFALGPRINAAGRLADMRVGIECLLTDDPDKAAELAATLDRINRERREIESDMRDAAMEQTLAALVGRADPPAALTVYDTSFHEGVVGIVASRLKDRLHRPTFVFAPAQGDGLGRELKGSGRSIAGFHLRDALDLLAKREPGVLLRFGGHAMAAGCTISAAQIARFQEAFEQIAREWIDAADLERRLECDGPLDNEFRRADVAELLNNQVWGQGFPSPVFCDDLEIVSQRLVAEKHLALRLRHGGQLVDGIWFGHVHPLPNRARLAYRLDADEFQGMRRVRFVIEACEGVGP